MLPYPLFLVNEFFLHFSGYKIIYFCVCLGLFFFREGALLFTMDGLSFVAPACISNSTLKQSFEGRIK